MSENWVIQNLENALGVWNGKLAEILELITQSPETFRGGTVWAVITDIHGALQAVGYALLVLFFAAGVLKTCGSFAELRRPEQALRLFVRFAFAKALITWGMEAMLALLEIVQGIISTVLSASGFGGAAEAVLSPAVAAAVEACGFWESIPLWAAALLGTVVIWVLSFVLILSVYGRFFRLYLYTAIAPVPLAAFAGEPTQEIGKSFLKSYARVCLEGAVIVLACVLFSVFASAAPVPDPSAAPVTAVWSYLGETVFNMLILTGAVKLSDRVVKEILGL